MTHGREIAESLLSNIIGITPTRIQLGHGSFITMDFGKDLTEQIQTRKGLMAKKFGQWHLWIYCSGWRIEKDHIPAAEWEDPRGKIETCLAELQKRNLREIHLLNSAFDATLFFGDDMELHLFAIPAAAQEQWMLFTPEDKVFTAGPGNKWSYENA